MENGMMGRKKKRKRKNKEGKEGASAYAVS